MLLKSSGLVVVSLAGLLRIGNGLDNGVALTPPMGFNSYMAGLGGGGEHTTPHVSMPFSCSNVEFKVFTHATDGLMSIAEYFVSSGLIHSGYEYVNSDEGQ